LARTRHDLDEPARLGKPLGEDWALRALEVGLLFTHDVEYFYSASRVVQLLIGTGVPAPTAPQGADACKLI
jgi:hypothetical protein